ncbi:MAG TPA: heavy metal translocating P-type ATPase [Bacilli bacterium]|jgi:Cd2+/Zn2+-exporting ATPase|nr:cadmium-translocating P-type ATPase [Bacilli bacterium]NLT01761.1 cadmium-translocating P-type ATPase [Acholeplasmataceae bacterium]HNZ77274.1 heavy metal translocating P-type ATPase [Bacilli bacterium]HOD60617.1 heavy metal translocating P-type ATPase [Bacilli bacterium]HOE07155.1 heavy metal translocating P-type ATPase [Bacilli bacterium]
MKNFVRQFKIENASGNMLVKAEILLEKLIGKGNFSLNKEKLLLTTTFKNDFEIDTKIAEIIDLIKSIDEDIEITEREIKPCYRKVLILENLDCANCAAKIERIAKRQFDHEFVVVDFATKKFIIETTDEELLNQLAKRVQEIATSVDSEINVTENTKKQFGDIDTQVKIDRKRRNEFIIGFSIFMIGFILKTILNRIGYKNELVKILIIYTLYIPAYILLAKDVLYGAFKNIASGRVFDEKFLMSLATIVALSIKYYDEALFVIIFYKLGELFQQYAVNYSRKSIAALMNFQPQKANIEINGEVIEVDPNEVVLGDVLLVNPGERIALDGEVIAGNASLDVSALTGESIEKNVTVGDEVLSGAICNDGNLRVKVKRIYEDSMVSKILHMVENASTLKSKSEAFISKFARVYTPIVVILAVLIAVFIPFISPKYDIAWENGFKDSIRVAMIFLVVSCPCALVISIPLGFFGGIGGASKHGILIKGSNYLEALNGVKTFVFDKTGTITQGNFRVKKIVSFGKYTEEELLYYAAHVEVGSNHPIAKAILSRYEGIIDSSKVISINPVSNRGVSAVVDQVNVDVGRVDYLKQLKVRVRDSARKLPNLFVAINGRAEGYFVIEDTIKDKAKETIDELKNMGITNNIILTGDSEKITTKVASKLNITEYYYEMNPIEKVQKIEEIKKRNPKQKVAFVGDGVNDAPVLSSADIGIAMGALGSDAAIEVADIVLMTDELSKLPIALKIARKTRRIIIQNIVLALAVKLVVLIIAPLNIAGINQFLIYEAIFADVGVSLIAILNSLRAMNVR